jgi:hypothetical protein
MIPSQWLTKMATKENLLTDLAKVTDKISSQVWTLNLGTLGTTWSLLIASGLPENIRFSTRNAIWVFVPCLFSLLCEMGQYLSAYFLDRKLLFEMEQNNSTEFHYRTDDALWRAREGLFHAKIVLTIAAAGILAYTLIRKYFS